jgi:hypothetical protein
VKGQEYRIQKPEYPIRTAVPETPPDCWFEVAISYSEFLF